MKNDKKIKKSALNFNIWILYNLSKGGGDYIALKYSTTHY